MTRRGQQSSRKAITARAREFRKQPTAAEARAWELLRNRRCLGLKFRRQWPLMGFVADFYCPQLKLVIELDGEAHLEKERSTQDRYRDAVLRELGVTIVRIPNSELTLDRLVEAIRAKIAGLTP